MIEAMLALQNDIAEMQNIVLYYENRILKKQQAIEELLHSMQSKQIVTKDQVLEEKEPGLYKIVRTLIEQEPNGAKYRAIRTKCLNLHPELRDKIVQQIWSVCNNLASKGLRIEMPEKKQKEVNRVFNEKAITNSHTTEHTVVS